MATVDRSNDVYPIFQQDFPIAVGGTTGVGFSLREFSGGFYVLYSAPIFSDGVYKLEVQESTDGGSTGLTVPANRILFPNIVAQTQQMVIQTLDPLEIVTPGGMTDGVSQLPRMIGALDFATDAMRLVITATSVTIGATILLQVFGYPQRKETQESHLG